MSRSIDHLWLIGAGVLYGLAIGAVARAEPVRGTVLDGTTLAPIGGATVVSEATGASVVVERDGSFELADAGIGELILRTSARNYEAGVQRIEVPEGGVEEIVLLLFQPGAFSEIIEMTELAPTAVAPGKQDLGRTEVTRIPGTRGDALSSLKSLPGVANADAPGQGPGLVVIRGAAPEDSKIMLDGVVIPVLYHFFGLQSVLPSEFISNIEFLPGGFGAEEGRATGGVINIQTRDEPITETAGFGELSFINLAAYFQTVVSDKHNLTVAGGLRRSTIDLILPAVLPDDANIGFTTAPQYYDGQLRFDWRPNARHRLTTLAIGSFDLLSLLNENLDPNEPAVVDAKFENETSFSRLISSWTYAKGDLQNRVVTSFGTTGFRFDVGAERFLQIDALSFEAKENVTYEAAKKLRLRAGADLRLDTRTVRINFPLPPPEGMPPSNFSTAPLVMLTEEFSNNIFGAFVAADLTPYSALVVTPGVRIDHFARYDDTTVSPRLQLSHRFAALTAKLALGTYSRGLDYAEALQTNLEAETATQYVVGGEYQLRRGVNVSLSGFYTDRRNLVVQDPTLSDVAPERAYVNRGYGRSYGVETLLRARSENFFGWIAYTVSRSDRVDGPMRERRLFDFDQTHNVIVVGSYTLGRWELGGRWQYSTGNPLTPIVGATYLADLNIYLPEFGAFNSTRIDAAHQLDLRIDRKWKFQAWELSAYLDVTNVYAHPKVLGYRYNFDYSEEEAIEELPFIPALGVRGSF